MYNKKLKKGYLEFVGYNAVSVTGSATLLRFLDQAILIDFGLRQTNDEEEDYIHNSKYHKDIKPNKLDAIICTHLHADHASLVPLLYKNGADCPVYIPVGSKQLYKIMLLDSCKIIETESERFNRKPIYTEQDVHNTLNHIVELSFNQKYRITDNIEVELYNAQHIVKASQLVFTLNDGVKTKRIGFTGDWSNYNNVHYIENMEPIPQVDVLVAEATYGDTKRLTKKKDRKNDLNKLDTAIKNAYNNHGKVIIPIFTLHRLQTVLAVLYEQYKDNNKIRILVDSPLGNRISEIWSNVIDKDHELWEEIKRWKNVYWISEYKDSINFMALDEPMVVLASGGFLKAGRARNWIKEYLSSNKNYIVFCGYASPESVAGQLKSGSMKNIKIDGKTVKNKAHIVNLMSFSSHADLAQLLKYYTETAYNKICLVHSEWESKNKFAELLKEKLSECNRSSRVVVVNSDSKVYI